jgi:lipopolysaccharide export system permease protein
MIFFERKPLLLYSYLATEMLAPFFASFVIMNCIFFLAKLIPFLDVVLELNISFADFLRSFSYLFPNMLLYSIPMASMMGVIIGFTRLSNDSEILAFKACGISVYNLVPPVILVSIMISMITAYFSIALIPAGEIAMKQLMYQLVKEKIDKGIKQKQFTAALGDLVVYVEDIDKDTNEWKDVWVSDMRGQKTPTITMAQTGRMDTDIKTMVVTIVLNNGSLHRSHSGQSQIVTFDNYVINIPLTPPTGSKTVVGIGGMTMQQLQEKAKFHGKTSRLGRNYLVHYHKRLVLPVGCLIMSLMALPLGLQSGPGKRASGIPLGLGFFILYYVAHTIGKTLAEDTNVIVGLSMWTPNLIFTLITAAAIIRVTNEKPLIPEIFSEKLLILRQKLALKKNKSENLDHTKRHPATAAQNDQQTYTSEGRTIIGNAKSRVFHFPECDFYSCKNCTIEFNSVEKAIESGYEPCRFCK